jgi:hypothetical protein
MIGGDELVRFVGQDGKGDAADAFVLGNLLAASERAIVGTGLSAHGPASP